MWKKIKCCLGWHEWEEHCNSFVCFEYCFLRNYNKGCVDDCSYHVKKCKHCGKVKR